jgi:hypothetical protein
LGVKALEKASLFWGFNKAIEKPLTFVDKEQILLLEGIK